MAIDWWIDDVFFLMGFGELQYDLNEWFMVWIPQNPPNLSNDSDLRWVPHMVHPTHKVHSAVIGNCRKPSSWNSLQQLKMCLYVHCARWLVYLIVVQISEKFIGSETDHHESQSGALDHLSGSCADHKRTLEPPSEPQVEVHRGLRDSGQKWRCFSGVEPAIATQGLNYSYHYITNYIGI